MKRFYLALYFFCLALFAVHSAELAEKWGRLNWDFQIPKPPQGKLQSADGLKFTLEILDAWNITVTPVDGIFTLKKKDNYTRAEKDDRSVGLPGKPYIAIRTERVEN